LGGPEGGESENGIRKEEPTSALHRARPGHLLKKARFT
jgi:hypothetical protein